MTVSFTHVYYGDKPTAGGTVHALGMCSHTDDPSDIAPRGPEHWDWAECGQCLNRAEKLGLEVVLTDHPVPGVCPECHLQHAGDC
jgi:hypothetical protein